MKEFFRNLKEDKLLIRGSVINLSLIVLSLGYIFLYYAKLPPFIPLFNQMPWGIDRITRTAWIFILPGISLLIFYINLFFSSFFYKKNPLIARLFSATSFFISVLTFLFIVRTIHTAL